jgi:hypothetical protein
VEVDSEGPRHVLRPFQRPRRRQRLGPGRGVVGHCLVFVVRGDGELTKPLTVHAQGFSKTAREKIEGAGGSVAELRERSRRR